MTATPAPAAPPAGGGVAQASTKEHTVSYPRKSVEFRNEMARITETAKKGGAHLRSAHAMEKRLTAKLWDILIAADIQMPHRWMRQQDMIELLEAAEERNEEATARRILAAEQEATAAKLEAQGGPRRLARAENLREHARLHRMQADQAEANVPAATGRGSVVCDNSRTWMAVRQTPAFAVALDIARQERRSRIQLDQARAALAAIENECEDGYMAGDNFTAARQAFRNDNNVLWGAARMLAAMVDNDDELGALQVLRDELDRQDAGQPA